jgi:hypothetical protein
MSATAAARPVIDEEDRRIIAATQDGLPLSPRPYHTVAGELGMKPAELMQRMQRMLDAGIIRRIAIVPNHYALGYKANAMTVWNVPDEHVTELGMKIGALDFVSHCYRRPRHPPDWPYNLFAMVHARTRAEIAPMIDAIADLLGQFDRGHDVLFSTRILKKTGLRLCGRRRF